ncbi:mutS protein homolog 5-like [Sitophilus oryzae]|uniref:MutS protein homolog 5-like n=1 Tax=Sitophilus oryzae TaxID=7048 RepID=A0A6J2XVV7_SITOR|nr:mutS protein homolog 5-like [Sitophilus oryzae]
MENIAERSYANLLCLLYRHGKLGAAYFNSEEQTLNLYEEMCDTKPQYLRSASILREVAPKYLLTFGNLTEEYVKAIVHFIQSANETVVTSDSLELPENVFLTSMNDYSYEVCKTIVQNINVASNHLERSDDAKQELYFHSIINWDHRLSIQALAALYKFIETHSTMFNFQAGSVCIMHINQVTLKNHVLIDNASFKTLKIFCQKSHDAAFKRGEESSSREGLSIYKLFLSSCKSTLGKAHLRNILLCPINQIEELNKRLDFISFVQDPNNSDFISNIHDNVKHLTNLNTLSEILEKIYNARASSSNWKTLYDTMMHIVFINDISKSYRNKNTLLNELNETVTENLYGLQDTINKALDFSVDVRRGRPAIKFGLDDDLDAKLLRRQDISKHVNAAARCALNDLPQFVSECKVVYLPEMGHLVAIKEWEPNCDQSAFQDLGYQVVFSIGGTIHYKTPICVEMDRRLGDINGEIIDHENRILRRLAGFVLKYNRDIREPLRLIALMDCLIAMAKVSQHNNYVKPTLNKDNVQELVKCRHPLMERILTSFEPNDYYSGGSHSHMKIITGPNGSGKSIYLKQVVLVVYLAHIGCYVPAERANIGMVHSIHCCGQSQESAAVRLSSFMIDIAQSSQILHYAAPSSLILLDEFGKSTLAEDGIVLLASFLKKFLSQNEMCPHIIVSTHFAKLATLLPENRYLEYYKTDHAFRDGTFCFLYQISKGTSKSFAFEIASAVLGDDIIQRAKQYYHCLQNNVPMDPQKYQYFKKPT